MFSHLIRKSSFPNEMNENYSIRAAPFFVEDKEHIPVSAALIVVCVCVCVCVPISVA